MEFIRPELRAAAHRWREVLAGAAALALGLYWVLGTVGLLSWLGFVLIAAGALMALVGVQRARFRPGSGGPGVVQVDEGQITYFGPLTGGAIAVADLERLMLDARAKPAHWVLEQKGQPTLYVPVNAAGADGLFDAFARLPGIRTERMLSEMRNPVPQAIVIWERTPMPRPARLH